MAFPLRVRLHPLFLDSPPVQPQAWEDPQGPPSKALEPEETYRTRGLFVGPDPFIDTTNLHSLS